ncbi:hypothetical protein M0812_11496 [Anaeramoeba flamelloides]|uniref:RING-type E3 ubiquitin transferase n=1 Tax=Anaeramoeba flamelloides TaxID=1746091 RepID=A0AAV7ZWB6_9EUKA|nr:hypothetical protein M0812_11496 [Anaeramoeba flamelloides]
MGNNSVRSRSTSDLHNGSNSRNRRHRHNGSEGSHARRNNQNGNRNRGMYFGMNPIMYGGQTTNGSQMNRNLAELMGIRVSNMPRKPPPKIHETTTVKNNINLKKDTLKLIKVGDENSRKFKISFDFDTGIPVILRVFWCANEFIRRKDGAIVFKSYAPNLTKNGFSFNFPKDISQSFEQDDQHAIDISDFHPLQQRCLIYKSLKQLKYEARVKQFNTIGSRKKYPSKQNQKHKNERKEKPKKQYQKKDRNKEKKKDNYNLLDDPSSATDHSSSEENEKKKKKHKKRKSNNNSSNNNQIVMNKGFDQLPALEEIYPVIICLEGNVGNFEREGNNILKNPQSQRTFATLVYNEKTKNFSIRVIKQKITVQGKTYLLKEIYGLDGNGNENGNGSGSGSGNGNYSGNEKKTQKDSPKTKKYHSNIQESKKNEKQKKIQKEQLTKNSLIVNNETRKECVICLDADPDTTILPCRHCCVCHECAELLRMKSDKCPMCRGIIKSLIQINIGEKLNK